MRHNPAMAGRRDTIVALLEERPYRTTDLADVLQLASGMHQVCAQLAREGVIKRLVDGRWAHPSHAGELAPPASIDTRCHIDGEAVLAQIQGGPIGCTAIATVLGVGKKAVQHRLELLASTGAIRSIGQHTGLRWALAEWNPSAPVPPRPRGRPRTRPAKDPVDEVEDDDVIEGPADPDAAIADTLLGESSRRRYPAGTRQKQPSKAAGEPGWWVGLSREEFFARAAARAADMSKSRESRWVSGKVLAV